MRWRRWRPGSVNLKEEIAGQRPLLVMERRAFPSFRPPGIPGGRPPSTFIPPHDPGRSTIYTLAVSPSPPPIPFKSFSYNRPSSSLQLPLLPSLSRSFRSSRCAEALEERTAAALAGRSSKKSLRVNRHPTRPRSRASCAGRGRACIARPTTPTCAGSATGGFTGPTSWPRGTYGACSATPARGSPRDTSSGRRRWWCSPAWSRTGRIREIRAMLRTSPRGTSGGLSCSSERSSSLHSLSFLFSITPFAILSRIFWGRS